MERDGEIPVLGRLSLPRPAHLFLRRRRALLHGGRLLPLLPDDAERRRTERGAHHQPQVGGVDEPQPRSGKPDGGNATAWGLEPPAIPQLTELGSVGSYYWGGFYYTSFVIDPKEDLIVIFMGQINPAGGLNLDSKAIALAYQAIKD